MPQLTSDLKAETNEVTRLFQEIGRGDKVAINRLLPLLYDELHRLARAYFRRERGEHTLQATALVHEAYLRMVDQRVSMENCGHFLAVAATQMRRVLIDHARRHRTARRGAGAEHVLLEDGVAICGPCPLDLIALDSALLALAALDPVQAQLVELRFFAGLSLEETAEMLQVSLATVKRGWTSARAFLRRKMQGGTRGPRSLESDPAAH